MQSVTLGDDEARKRKVQKTILERKGPPTFTCAVEMISKTECRVHHKLEATVDAILAGRLLSSNIICMKQQVKLGQLTICLATNKLLSLTKFQFSLSSLYNPDLQICIKLHLLSLINSSLLSLTCISCTKILSCRTANIIQAML